MTQVAAAPHLAAVRELRDWINRYAQVRDLIPLGGYVPGADAKTDRAVDMHERVASYLQQGMHESAPFGESIARMEVLVA